MSTYVIKCVKWNYRQTERQAGKRDRQRSKEGGGELGRQKR